MKRDPDRNTRVRHLAAACALAWLLIAGGKAEPAWAELSLELAGARVTPHVMAAEMRYSRDPDPELGARVQLFVRNTGSSPVMLMPTSSIRVSGKTPEELLAQDKWTWHDFPSAYPESPVELPAGCLTAWSFNGKRADWGVGTRATLEWRGEGKEAATARLEVPIDIAKPQARISAATFLPEEEWQVEPSKVILHVANEGDWGMKPISFRPWLPKSGDTFRILVPGTLIEAFETWPSDGRIPAGEKGIIRATTGPLPLTYVAIELRMREDNGRESTLWSHLRIKPETFDISGGWVQGGEHARKTMTFEPFLKTLRRMHVNTAHMGDGIPGYTDQTQPGGLYARYPLKFFGHLVPPERYETPEMLPRVHAVEFLGEPQYGGGRPVAPMDVWRKLAPFQSTKLPTSVTHSEERIWRYYAGLSDYPHYDAYRVCAPSPDSWFKYTRWEGRKIGWGAPLETIGDMCRSLRELNEPMATAYWSQGPHQGWGPMWGRRRSSPTADELRLQAYHALASRITSLYWFNLSLPSIVKFRDTLEELTRIGREIRMLEDFYLAGDAYQYHRQLRDGRPDWDLASIAAPEGTLLFALDLDYDPDNDQRVFLFHPPRDAQFEFRLPAWCRKPAEVFRVDADGTHDVTYRVVESGIKISDRLSKVGAYVVAPNAGTRARLDERRRELLEYEAAFAFDPANNDSDFEQLVEFANELKKR